MTSALPKTFNAALNISLDRGPHSAGHRPASRSLATPVSIVHSNAQDHTCDRPREKTQQTRQSKARDMEASSLAHDVRNWLTVLQVYCDLLRTSGAVVSGHQNWIDELSSTVTRGHALVASLLHSVQGDQPDCGAIPFTLPDALSQQRPSGLLDLSQSLKRRLPLLQQLAGDKIEVAIDTLRPLDKLGSSADYGQVALSEGDFDRILHNLVGNAIESMPQGGQLRIALTLVRAPSSKPRRDAGGETGKLPGHDAMHRSPKLSSAETLLLQVCDTGIGIASRLMPHIFELGVSSKVQADHALRGHGLAIVQDLTLRAGGSVFVRSNPRGGTCFSIELPVAQNAHPGKLRASLLKKASASRAKRKSSLPIHPHTSGRLHRDWDQNCCTAGKERA